MEAQASIFFIKIQSILRHLKIFLGVIIPRAIKTLQNEPLKRLYFII